MAIFTLRNGFLALVAMLAAVSLAGGVLYLLGHFSVDTGGAAMRTGVGVTLIASGLALGGGLWVSRRSAGSGGSLMAAGAVPAAICFWWTGVVPAVALPIAAVGIVRARRQRRTRKVVA
jgi:hypothetical protein